MPTGHTENVFRQRQQAVAQLCHKGIAEARNQDRDNSRPPPGAGFLDRIGRRQRLSGLPEEGSRQQQLHQRQHGSGSAEHGGQHEKLLAHRGMRGRGQRGVERQRFSQPVHGGRQTAAVVSRQPVVGFQQLNPARGAIGHRAVGGVPGSFFRRAAQKFRSQVGAQQVVGHVQLIIAEIAEFISIWPEAAGHC